MNGWWRVEPIGWSETGRAAGWASDRAIPTSVLASTAEIAAMRYAEDVWRDGPPPIRAVLSVRAEVGTSGVLANAPAETFEVVPRTVWNTRRVG